MTDDRYDVLDRFVPMLDPATSFEGFLAKRDRRRRRQRLAAGIVGVVVAAAIAIPLARSLESDRPRSVGSNPSPTSSPTIVQATEPFRSTLYAYTLSYPGTWTVRRADATWTAGELTSDVADAFLDGDVRMLEIASIQIPERMSDREWLDHEEDRYARLAGISDGNRYVTRQVIDGEDARNAVNCHVILVVSEGRGYVIRLHQVLEFSPALQMVIRSIELHPDEAA
jgi:hypothetical protein